MKIRLESKHESCPERLQCLVCDRTFPTNKIRTLVYNDRGLLQGDICPDCLQLKSEKIKYKLREKALLMLTKRVRSNIKQSSLKPQAMELLALSQEKIKLPNFWQWLIKKMSIASEEYQEIEAARLGMTQCTCQQRSKLERLFEKEI
jgi:hypothetical protein